MKRHTRKMCKHKHKHEHLSVHMQITSKGNCADCWVVVGGVATSVWSDRTSAEWNTSTVKPISITNSHD